MEIHPVSKESPDMSDAEFKQLVDDIRKNGQLVPIWKMGKQVIDGRKRLRACEVLGIEPNVVEVSSEDPVSLAHSLNVLRTHYTPSQRAMFAAKLASWDSRYPKTRSMKVKCDHHNRAKTNAEAGAEVGVSRTEVIYAKQLQRASQEMADLVERGKISLYRANQIVKTIPKEQQLQAAKEAIKKGPRGHVSGFARRQSPGSPDERMQRSCRDLQIIIETMDEVCSFVSDSSSWLGNLRKCRTELTRIINQMEGDAG